MKLADIVITINENLDDTQSDLMYDLELKLLTLQILLPDKRFKEFRQYIVNEFNDRSDKINYNIKFATNSDVWESIDIIENLIQMINDELEDFHLVKVERAEMIAGKRFNKKQYRSFF